MQIDETRLEGFLNDLGLSSAKELGSDDLRRAEAYIQGVPFVDLKKVKLDFATLSLIPEPIARNHNIVAFHKTANALEVALLDLADLSSVDFLKEKTGLKILPRLTDEESMKSALRSYQKILKAEFGALLQKKASLDTLLKHALLQNASDIHLEPEENEMLVRYRIAGTLHDAMVLPKEAALGVMEKIKALAQDGRFKIDADGEKISFRVSVLPTERGEKMVVSLFRENTNGFSLETLGLQGQALEDVYAALKERSGLILVSGPKGAGKTTALYTLVDLLNTPDVSISTIEDPIEFQMKRVNQCQAHPEIGLSVAQGARAILRQDPDIIMIGEIRDSETAMLAISAAVRGSLVLSSVAANSAVHTVRQMLDFGAETQSLASALKVVISRGVKKGAAGPAYSNEVLKVTATIKDLILNGATSAVIEEQARKEGMVALEN